LLLRFELTQPFLSVLVWQFQLASLGTLLARRILEDTHHHFALGEPGVQLTCSKTESVSAGFD